MRDGDRLICYDDWRSGRTVMRLLACLVPLIALAASPVPKPSGRCPAITAQTAKNGAKPLVHSLADEPGARQEIAVQRVDGNGCVKPVIVRENIGGTAPPLVAADPATRQTSSTSRP
jgi:hypothetical protein